MRTFLLGVAAVSVVGVGAWLLTRPTPVPDHPPIGPTADGVWFEDVAAQAGVAFTHFDPATPRHLIPETIGTGVGWIDYDADGWPDLVCVQSGPLPPAIDGARTHKVYRNNRDGTFTDVTARTGLDRAGYGQGCAVGDYDNDGFDDLVVTSLGGLALFHNEPDPSAPGGRRFRDATPGSNLANPHWGTSCAWGDLDGDGFLDLYVCNYVEFDPATAPVCRDEAKQVGFTCSPTAYPQTTHRLYRNNRDGTFADVSHTSGIATAPAAGLGVLIADLDGDGKPDVYVANDMNPAFLFRNAGGMSFEDIALGSGVAFGPGGTRMAGMGVEAADFDGSGRPSLFVTNFQRLPNGFFRNRGNGRFDDGSFPSGLGAPSVERLGFGTCALDADLDGHPDLAVANGHVQRTAADLFGATYAQAGQLFLGDGAGRFRDASAGAGDLSRPRVGRGLARADFDQDGLPDLALSAIGQGTALLRNRTRAAGNWVSLELVGDGKRSNRNAVGAVAKVEWAGRTRHHFVTGGGSYLSASYRQLLVGVGGADRLDAVTVRWPSGGTQVYRNLPTGTRWRLTEGRPDPELVRLPAK